jgi:hypothetical protein
VSKEGPALSAASRTNRRPALPLTSLHALDIDLPESGSAWLVCPDCRHWCEIVRGLVQTHKPNGARCPGSGQLIDFDLTPAQHTALCTAARQWLQAKNQNRAARPILREGTRRATRRIATHAAAQYAEQRTRTAMGEALMAAWEKAARIPAAPAVHQIAAQRATRPAHPAQVTGHGWPEFWLTRTQLDHANSATTKHTCGGPVFGRKTPGCPRCDELLAGAEPVRWNTRRRDDEAARLAEIRAHDCARSGCGPVCTAFQW